MGWVLVSAVVWMILTGRLVPRSVSDEKDELANTWRQAWLVERDRNDRLITPTAQIAQGVFRGLPPLPDADEQEGT
jgi:hypothetical protein